MEELLCLATSVRWLALICFAPFQRSVRCLAEVYLVQVSNERDFGVLVSC